LPGAFLNRTDLPFAMAFLVELGAFFEVMLAMFQQTMEQQSEFVSHGFDGFRLIRKAAEPAILCPKVALTFQQRRGCLAEGGGSSVLRLLVPPPDDFPTAHVVDRAQVEPTGKVAFRGPPAHVDTGLCDHRLGGHDVDTVHARPIHPADPVELLSQVELGCVAARAFAGFPRA